MLATAQVKKDKGEIKMAVKPNVMKFAKKISKESNTYMGITENDPEYRILAPVTTEEMAEVGLGMKFRKYMTTEEIAKNCGKPVDYCQEQLEKLAHNGTIKWAKDGKWNGVDHWFLPFWVPGLMECMVLVKENTDKYPDIANSFEEFTLKRTQILAPNMPAGNGLMRVIPVQKEIDATSTPRDYEELSTYIENATMISVSDCFCRRTRRIMGEGCGHLEKDMCINLNDGAEFLVRIGVARQIDKKEAYEILQRAEDNGLIHEMPNIEGEGLEPKMAICNCCGCACFSLRVSEYYNTANFVRSNYVAQVDKDKCVACGQCVENCQMNAVRLGQKLCSKEPVVTTESIKHPNPANSMWGKDKWNPEFRFNREDVVETGTAPCKTNCPAHIGIQGYIKLAAQGKYDEALELIKMDNPLPAVCGHVCNRRCEQACTRGEIDDPVAIDEIKKFIAMRDLNAETRFVPKMLNQIGEKYTQNIAVIGGGPAGISCAFYLAKKGYPVTVFEKNEKPGGMLVYGIPSFVLEKDVVAAEIEVLKEMGVTFKCGVEVGKDITIPELRQQGYKAIYLAIGCQGGRKVGVPGEDAQGVLTGVEFLHMVSDNEETKLQGRTVVIGGGNVAIDVARCAVRSGSTETSMVCLETRDIMPASEEEIEIAEAEDIKMNCGWGPKEILTADGKVTGIVFKKCTSVKDADGRFNPQYDENETMTIDCENVLLSVGQSIEWGNLLEGTKVELGRGNGVVADSFTYQTKEPDIFAGGDVYTGPKFAIDAIAAGKEAAVSIHRFVNEGQSLTIGRDRKIYKELNKAAVDFSSFDNSSRQVPGKKTHVEAKTTYRDMKETFTQEQVQAETERCLGCGASVVDEFKCVGCGICTTKCRFDAIHLKRVSDVHGEPIDGIMGVLAPSLIKRGAKIAIKPITSIFSKN